MSIVLSSKKNPPALQYDINWKVDEIANFLDLYLGDPKLEYLISAEYMLKNLVDGLVHGRRQKDPPF
jgi:hypothetical protein